MSVLWRSLKKRAERSFVALTKFGSISVSGQLPTYPSPNSIDCRWVRGGVGGQLPRYWYWSQSSMESCCPLLSSSSHPWKVNDVRGPPSASQLGHFQSLATDTEVNSCYFNTTQVNSAFRALLLASSEVNSKYYSSRHSFISERPIRRKRASRV